MLPTEVQCCAFGFFAHHLPCCSASLSPSHVVCISGEKVMCEKWQKGTTGSWVWSVACVHVAWSASCPVCIMQKAASKNDWFLGLIWSLRPHCVVLFVSCLVLPFQPVAGISCHSQFIVWRRVHKVERLAVTARFPGPKSPYGLCGRKATLNYDSEKTCEATGAFSSAITSAFFLMLWLAFLHWIFIHACRVKVFQLMILPSLCISEFFCFCLFLLQLI